MFSALSLLKAKWSPKAEIQGWRQYLTQTMLQCLTPYFFLFYSLVSRVV